MGWVRDLPSLPSANLTWVGFSWARKALNICILVLLSRKARKTPRPRPNADPTLTCVPILPAAVLSTSRSVPCRSCLKCSSASALISLPAFFRSKASESDDILCNDKEIARLMCSDVRLQRSGREQICSSKVGKR